MRYLLIILACFSFLMIAEAQVTVEIKDSRFRAALCAKYDTVMDETCELLDTMKAQNFDDTSVVITGQGLVSVEEIVYFNRIDTIVLSNNSLNHFLDEVKPEVFWSLVYLDISNNKIKKLPQMTTSKEFNGLRYLYYENNQIDTIQNYWAFWDTLKVINISNNNLHHFHDASYAKEAELIDISNNYLTFEDLVPQTLHQNFAQVFTVFPQKKVSWGVSGFEGQERDTIILTLPIDENITSNTYEWYKDDVLIETTTINKLTIDSLELSDAGEYRVIVRNSTPQLKEVYLESESITLEVTPCMDVSFFEYELDPKCYGGDLEMDFSSVQGGVSPYRFTLESNTIETKVLEEFEMVLTGRYVFKIEDQVGCVKVIDESFNVIPPANCDENVITPNGDGVQDLIYFPQEGQAVIYNQRGQEITKIQLPYFWDAKDKNGKITPPGKYIMIINGSQQVALKVVW